MKEIKPTFDEMCRGVKIFLAGSIEMGNSENWQEKVIKKFTDFSVTFYNPRRDE